MELDPVGGRSAADEHELVLLQMEQNAVADHIAVVGARHELLGAVDGEFAKLLIGRDGRAASSASGPSMIDVDHVVGLVEENGALAPGTLLARQLVNSAATTG